MKTSNHLIITISRQQGSGGAYIGQKLAKKLKICYADREIIRRAAEKLSVSEEELKARDEKTQSWWEYVLESSRYAPEIYVPPVQKFAPTDLELYTTESEIIKQVTKKGSAVIIGRCGFHILQGHPNCVRVFLHADIEFRINRIKELYKLSKKDAIAMIEQYDRKRALYIKKFTKTDWTDSTQYDLCVNSGKIGLDKTVDLIAGYVKAL